MRFAFDSTSHTPSQQTPSTLERRLLDAHTGVTVGTDERCKVGVAQRGACTGHVRWVLALLVHANGFRSQNASDFPTNVAALSTGVKAKKIPKIGLFGVFQRKIGL